MEKYVKLEDVKELLNLIYRRDSFYDWTSEYDKYEKLAQEKAKEIERSAIAI